MIYLVISLIHLATTTLSMDLPCCVEKQVGGVDYILIDHDTGMTSNYGCSSDCVYERFQLK